MILFDRSLLKTCLLILLLLASGCSKQIISVAYPPKPAPPPKPEPPIADRPQPRTPAVPTPESTPPAPPAVPAPDPRQTAARNLVREGIGHLGRGDATAAIDALEQSLSLDARNGETYYYLAEAWNRNGNQAQARQFHRLARSYLEGRAGWNAKLDRQAGKLGF